MLTVNDLIYVHIKSEELNVHKFPGNSRVSSLKKKGALMTILYCTDFLYTIRKRQ